VKDEDTSKQDSQSQQTAGWAEVGRQFEVLGETLATALRTSLDNEQNRQRMEAIRRNLEAMVRDVDSAIQDATKSPGGQQARAEMRRAAETLRDTGEQTAQEVRPHLVAALKQVNEELRKLVSSMDHTAGGPPSGSAKDR
jgi:hypothetical protein